MKKVILALAIVSVSFAACNNSGESTEPKTDTPAVETPAPAAPDTAATAPATPDTAAKTATPDSTKK